MPEKQPRSEGRAYALDARKIGSLIYAPEDPNGPDVWQRGILPDRCFLIADGFASRSCPDADGTDKPLLEILKPIIEQVDPYATIRGFSYSFPGKHYTARHTNIRLLQRANELFDPYKPRPGLSTICLTFSLAAPLFALALASYLTNDQPASAAIPKALVLIEPAFDLKPEAIDALISNRGYPSPPEPILDFADPTTELPERVISSLSVVTQSTRVFMLYWPQDPLTIYTDGARLKRIDETGVERLPPVLLPTFSARSTPFQQHCAVSRADEMHHALLQLLRSLPT